MRDMQRQKVYKAEAQAFSHLMVGPGQRFASVDEIQAYVDRVLRSQWFKTQVRKGTLRKSRLIVRARRNDAKCGKAGRGILWVAMGTDYSPTEYYTLHEMAHLLEPTGVARHNWQFCAAYVLLVHHFMGAEASKALKARFRKHRVKFTAPRPKQPKRELTEAQKDVLRERLAKARATKALKQVEAEHDRCLALYSRYWKAAAQADAEGDEWQATQWRESAERYRARTNTLYARIGDLKYAMATA